MLLQIFHGVAPGPVPITREGLFSSLVPVILGNIVCGSVLVGFAYHLIYRRTAELK